MSSTRKYLALALAAFKNKQYEESGVLFAQAALADDASEIADELGKHGEQETTEALASGNSPSTDREGDLEAGVSDEQVTATPPASESGEDDLEWGDADLEPDEDAESTSSATRRRTTSLFHLGKILAASMALASDDEAEDVEDEDDDSEDADADFDGEVLVPASFSSVTVKTGQAASDE